MKRTVLLVVFLFTGQFSMADGFLCTADQERLSLKLYNHTSPWLGTRRGAILILSDNFLPQRDKTIAIFRDERRALVNIDGVIAYEAFVDRREDAYLYQRAEVLGTDMDEIYQFVLEFNFSYTDPLPSGVALDGSLLIIKRNGEKVSEKLNCERYLKGQPISPN